MSHRKSLLRTILMTINVGVFLAGIIVSLIGIRVGNEPLIGMTEEQIDEMMNDQGNSAGPMAILLMGGGAGLIVCGVGGMAIQCLSRKKVQRMGDGGRSSKNRCNSREAGQNNATHASLIP